MNDARLCLRLFRANRDAGLIVVAGFALAALVAGAGATGP